MNKVININLMRKLPPKEIALARIVAKILPLRDCVASSGMSPIHNGRLQQKPEIAPEKKQKTTACRCSSRCYTSR
jgi:hypothetical protein